MNWKLPGLLGIVMLSGACNNSPSPLRTKAMEGAYEQMLSHKNRLYSRIAALKAENPRRHATIYELVSEMRSKSEPIHNVKESADIKDFEKLLKVQEFILKLMDEETRGILYFLDKEEPFQAELWLEYKTLLARQEIAFIYNYFNQITGPSYFVTPCSWVEVESLDSLNGQRLKFNSYTAELNTRHYVVLDSIMLNDREIIEPQWIPQRDFVVHQLDLPNLSSGEYEVYGKIIAVTEGERVFIDDFNVEWKQP